MIELKVGDIVKTNRNRELQMYLVIYGRIQCIHEDEKTICISGRRGCGCDRTWSVCYGENASGYIKKVSKIEGVLCI